MIPSPSISMIFDPTFFVNRFGSFGVENYLLSFSTSSYQENRSSSGDLAKPVVLPSLSSFPVQTYGSFRASEARCLALVQSRPIQPLAVSG